MSGNVDLPFLCSILALVYSTNAFLVSDGLHSVNTKYGEIVGYVENVNFDDKTYQVAKFLGIPFAEPPVGDLRFRKPVPIQTLTTPFLAHSHGPACIQKDSPVLHIPYSEDCLYLNIFKPLNLGQSGNLPKPVMVWIHGGGFFIGSTHTYDGNVICAFTDVIIVTIQYRLGPLGFFSTHDLHARGNYGVWDQHMAIKWVKDNIHSFGGDSNNITIFGESAGGSSVVYQLMYPGNDGLFKRAIAESGTISAWAVTTKENNYNASMMFAQAVGCDLQTHNDIIACIRSKSMSEVEAAAAKLNDYTFSQTPVKWVPVYDGDFVVAEPETLLDEALNPTKNAKFSSFRNIDLLIGANNYDGGLLPYSVFEIFDYDTLLTEDELRAKYIPMLMTYVHQGNAAAVSVEAIINEYRDYKSSSSWMGALLNMSTDAALTAPTVKTARAHRLGGKSETYLYQFAVAPPKKLRSIPLPSDLYHNPAIANHGEEVAYVFGFDHSKVYYKNFTAADIRPGDIDISKLIMTAWANFARSGNPNFPTSLRSMADVNWKPFGDDENYLEITPTMNQGSLKSRLSARGVDFWNNLLPRLQALG